MEMKGLTKKEILLLPKSFDIVGDILIFNDFPEELEKKEKLVGNYFLKLHKNIKVVIKKIESYSGKYRLPKLKILAGEKRKETIHKENNVKIKLNVEKCYFSSRLANERLRIASLIKKDEEVLVMFSGVAPYLLVISKNSKAKEIFGIEINPIAHKYALENLKLNKIGNIKLFKGDVKRILPKINKKFNRIIMPLPKGSENYLDLALKSLKKNGIIHFYDFEENFEGIIDKIKKHCKPDILDKKICGSFSPKINRICIDFKKKIIL